MRRWKTLLKKFLVLPLWFVVILTIISAIALIFVFVKKWNTLPYVYIVYTISFYTFVVLCIALSKIFPKYYKIIKQKVYKNKYANSYLTDVNYKTHINLYVSLSVNLLYVVTNAISAVVYHTIWFASFAVYYGIMAIMHFILVRYIAKNHIGKSRLGELKRSRVCAYILLTVNLILSGVVLMMVYYNRGFEYQGYLIYVIALYTFYTTVTTIVDIIKYRKYNNPIMSVSKAIKLASSLFSMLFLETAMFSQFGQDTSIEVEKIMIMATGAGICVVVVVMSVYIIICSSKEIVNNS